MFSPLIREISNYQDPLSCLCAWSLFREIACESTSQWNGADISASICQIIGPLVKTLLKECEDVALLVGVLTAVAPIIGTSPKADEEGTYLRTPVDCASVQYLRKSTKFGFIILLYPWYVQSYSLAECTRAQSTRKEELVNGHKF